MACVQGYSMEGLGLTWRALAARSAISSALGTVCGPLRSARSASRDLSATRQRCHGFGSVLYKSSSEVHGARVLHRLLMAVCSVVEGKSAECLMPTARRWPQQLSPEERTCTRTNAGAQCT